MAIHSMTGFARALGGAHGFDWTWEVRSVNGKGLDTRLRVPTGHEAVDQPARERIGKRMKRGNVSATLSVAATESRGGHRVNTEVLEQILAAVPQVRAALPEARPPSIDGLLAIRGALEFTEDEVADEVQANLAAGMLATLDEALDALVTMRAEEGARLLAVLTGQLDAIAGLCADAARVAATQPAAIKARLQAQLADLLEASPPLPEERLAQEAALLMTKADVREELDRLDGHVAAARDLLAGGGPVGRKLDFLCQEFNREANTLCSKSADLELTRIGLDLKATIEQFREQVQNIE